jgi:3-deoxy-D-manno-octulosonate 8-phosphate phosphatase (KDO 8-P phosphatase)
MEKKLNYKVVLRTVKLLVFDVDGVLSDGHVYLDADGEMMRNTHVNDGLAIKLALKAGLKVIVISAGTSKKVKERMHYLGIKDVFMGVYAKFEVLSEYCKQNEIDFADVLYMGDDLPDYECMINVGVATCPNNAAVEIRSIADYISHKDGGKGCVRDIVEQTLRVQGGWPDLTKNPRIEF